ncbi:MAG: nitroreductase family protein [Chlorobi bacterium]|nr:nitroreductase family protein [Chlorobiota bacterium]
MKKPTNNNYPINELLKHRWSPRAYSEKPVETEKFQSILEAARWAPSAFNEQPWRFIVGVKGDKTWDMILETLVEWNRQWAGKAPVLVLNIGKKTHTRNGKNNVTFKYDTGQAVAMMVTEAVNQGLFGHQMSGFDAKKAAELFAIPDDYQAITVTAFGYYGNTDELPEDMYKSEIEERKRRSLKELVFSGKFGEPSNWV